MISTLEKEIISVIINLMLRASPFEMLYDERPFRVDSLKDGRYSRLTISAISYNLNLLITLAGSLDSTVARA